LSAEAQKRPQFDTHVAWKLQTHEQSQSWSCPLRERQGFSLRGLLLTNATGFSFQEGRNPSSEQKIRLTLGRHNQGTEPPTA